ncbi:MAG: glucose 1-dehydrogenase [Thermoproteota archaeon]|jgi:glucose 1-dehydrogenase|nr:glucose 1-dehydrogenase [Thermoproteota archaeon]
MSEARMRNNSANSVRKVAVVTGSDRGIGRAIALAFAKSNRYSGIVVNARKREETEKVAKEIRDGGTNTDSIAVIADVSQETDCIRLIDEAVKHFGRIDVLVNNAGIQQEVPFEDTSIEIWQKIIAVDLTGPFVCSREVVKHMLNQKNPEGGCIINISSVHQVIPKPHYIPYATSKAGIEMMTKTMALELAQHNIRVNVVAPGAIETDMNQELRENKNELNKVLMRIPLRRIGSPEEIANMVEFLASDKASYITGSAFFVDGGMTLYPSFDPSFDLGKQKDQ